MFAETLESALLTHALATRRSEQRNRSVGRSIRPTPLVLSALPVLAFVTVGIVHIVGGAPFGHDEAVYASRARDFALREDPGGYWTAYRAPGLPLVLAPVWAIVESDTALRLVVLLFGAAGIALTITLAWRLFDPWIGVLSGALLAITPGYLQASILTWPDVPGAVFGLAAIAALVFAAGGPRIHPVVLLAIPLAALATHTRFGAPVPVAVGLTVFTLYRWRTARRSIALVATTALGALGAIAAIFYVPALTASDQAPQEAIRSFYLAGDAPWWTPAKHFWGQIGDLFGRPLLLLLTVGVVLAILAWFRHWVPRGPLVAVGATLGFTLLGLVYTLAHGEPRFLAPALPFLMILAATGLVALARRLDVRACATMLLALTLAGAYGLHAEGRETMDLLDYRWRTLRFLSAEIDQQLTDDCAVVTSYVPQIHWYTTCDAVTFPEAREGKPYGERLTSKVSKLDRQNVVMLLLEGGKRQPDGSDLESALSSATLMSRVGSPGEQLQYGEVHRLR